MPDFLCFVVKTIVRNFLIFMFSTYANCIEILKLYE